MYIYVCIPMEYILFLTPSSTLCMFVCVCVCMCVGPNYRIYRNDSPAVSISVPFVSPGQTYRRDSQRTYGKLAFKKNSSHI